MTTYHIKLREFKTDVVVPREVKGLRAVADYITRELAHNFAMSKKAYPVKPLMEETEAKRLKGIEQNWYDSHLDPITEFLMDLRDKLRAKYGRV